jgi:hypothetical protein
MSGVTETTSTKTAINLSYALIERQVMDRLELSFGERARRFAMGPRFRKEGRAPYLAVLKWLSQSDAWSIQLDELLNKNINHRSSVGQIVEKGYLSQFIDGRMGTEHFHSVLNFDPTTKFLSAEDPQFMFYIKNLDWKKFVSKVGFTQAEFDTKYDCALSFAGERRAIAEEFAKVLGDGEISVFYDNKEQHLITGAQLDNYLGPIYESEADFVIVLLSQEYPNKAWARFERDKFEGRFNKGDVIPIKFSDVQIGAFDKLEKIGYLTFDINKPMQDQVRTLCDVVSKKILDRRLTNKSS